MDFANVAKKYRPIPFWSWNEKLDCFETAEQVHKMDGVGIGGFFMHARGGLQTEYMSKEWFENVDSVVTGGAADLAGIKEGDVITECNGEKVENVDQINQIRDKHKVGDKIKFTISRNGSKMKIDVVLQEEKPTSEVKKEEVETPKQQYLPSDFFSFFGW